MSSFPMTLRQGFKLAWPLTSQIIPVNERQRSARYPSDVHAKKIFCSRIICRYYAYVVFWSLSGISWWLRRERAARTRRRARESNVLLSRVTFRLTDQTNIGTQDTRFWLVSVGDVGVKARRLSPVSLSGTVKTGSGESPHFLFPVSRREEWNAPFILSSHQGKERKWFQHAVEEATTNHLCVTHTHFYRRFSICESKKGPFTQQIL